MKTKLSIYTILLGVITTVVIVSCTPSTSTPIVVKETSIVRIPVTVEVTRIVEVVSTVEVPVTVEVTRIKEVIATPSPVDTLTPTPTISPDHNFSGRYVFRMGESLAEDGGCILQVTHKITHQPFDEIDFELECNRGAPTYNMGHLTGTVLFDRHLAKMAVYSSPDNQCSLVFEFGMREVNVSQIGESSACGFGHAVYASGLYLK